MSFVWGSKYIIPEGGTLGPAVFDNSQTLAFLLLFQPSVLDVTQEQQSRGTESVENKVTLQRNSSLEHWNPEDSHM